LNSPREGRTLVARRKRAGRGGDRSRRRTAGAGVATALELLAGVGR